MKKIFLSFARHKEVVELLIANGADVNAADKRGNTALSLAQAQGNVEIIAILSKRSSH